MIKRVVLLTALCAASGAWAQQSLDISEKDVASGAAQSRLSALSRAAAASGKRVVVTAPQHLHAKIAAGLAAGGKTEVVLRDGFYENVLVRIEDKVEEPAKPEPRAEVRPASPPPPPPVRSAPSAPRVPAAAPVASPAPAPAASQPAPVETASPPAAPSPPQVNLSVPPAPTPATTVQSKPGASPSTASKPAVSPSAPQASSTSVPAEPIVFIAREPGDTDPARDALEKLYNDGRRIRERIAPSGLKNGDILYIGTQAAVVTRRDGKSLLRFWLEGEITLDQRNLEAEGRNRYRVIGSGVR